MADYFMSITAIGDSSSYKDPDHVGTSSTSGDELELRITYTQSPAATRIQALQGLERFRRWILQGGLDSAGANLPTDPAP